MITRFAILITLALSGVVVGQSPDPYVAAIRAAGISPTKEGLSKYLLSQIPSDEKRARELQLVRQLSDASFQVRERAEAELSKMSDPPIDLLKQAAQAEDPEMRYRARHVLGKAESGGTRSAANAVLGYIAHHEMPGLAHPVLQYLPYSGDSSAHGLAGQAALATVTPDDLDLLRRALKRNPPLRRAVCVLAIAKLQGEAAGDELTPLLEHEDAVVQLAAAEALANFGRRDVLATLIALLASEELEIRRESNDILRSFTHENFEFVPYGKEAARAEAIDRWHTWLAKDGETVELHFPLVRAKPYLGRTLMSLYPNKLREIDADGNELMATGGFRYIWGCHATADGFRVVTDYNMRLLVEYDAAGKQSLRLTELPGQPSDVHRLASGNFLLALSDTNKVVEIDRQGDVVWSIDLEGRPTTVDPLGNGNYLVNLQFGKRVVEVNRAGEVIWELPGLNNVLTAQALPGGNVLVCEMVLGKAIEYNRAGKVVWEKRGFESACQAQRLPDGHTLISDRHGLHEVDVAGDTVWSLEVPRGRFWRY